MNLAFQSLFLLVLLLPGTFFLTPYYRGGLQGSTTSGTVSIAFSFPGISTYVIRAAIIAVLLNACWATIFYLLCHPINMGATFYFLIGNFSDSARYGNELKQLSDAVWIILLYFFTLYIFAYILGWITRKTVLRFNLDLRIPLLRFNDDWYYAFSGRALALAEERAADGTVVCALVDTADEATLYVGILLDYTLKSDGNLKEIHLTSASRRSLVDDRKPGTNVAERFYDIEGNFLILKYADITNLNILYIYLEEEG